MIVVLLAALTHSTDITPETTPDTNEPVVAEELLHQRINTYIDAGIPLTKTVKLTLTDAIETINIATEHEFTGPVEALTEQTFVSPQYRH